VVVKDVYFVFGLLARSNDWAYLNGINFRKGILEKICV
jgi:hypothetical protein